MADILSIDDITLKTDLTNTDLTIPERHGIFVGIAREDAELSQQALAERVGTSQQTISRIEKGQQTTGDEMRVLIARALGKPTARLFPYYDAETF